MPNLTLLIGLVLVSLVYSIKKTFFYIILIFSIYIFFNIQLEYNIKYFTDRFEFQEVQNVSTLAFFSGWERAYLSLSETNFFGVGFNQLGIVGPSGIYHQQLELYDLQLVSLKDGGSVAPKLIAELGFLGIIMLLIYLFYFIKKLHIIKIKNLTFSYLDTFYHSIFIMSFINLFVRGSGYFSPIFFLFLSSIIYFCTNNNRSHNISSKK